MNQMHKYELPPLVGNASVSEVSREIGITRWSG